VPVLSGSGLSPRKGAILFDDPDADVLAGSAGLDWLFSDPLLDRLHGRRAGEETS
jgi:hypothetical protein